MGKHGVQGRPGTLPTTATRLLPNGQFTTVISKRKNVSTACDVCRQSRTKCSGDSPCVNCANANIECLFQSSRDGRRKESRKRKVQDLESDSDLLGDLIQTIKDSDDLQLAQLVSLIRSNATLRESKLCIQQRLSSTLRSLSHSSPEPTQSDGYIPEVDREGTDSTDPVTHHRRNPMDITRLADDPPYKVPAKPWTTVTDDDALVSNLVSVWLTWDKHFFNWFDQDAFLRDMQRGQLHARYCSSFMVNALLAIACCHTDYHEAKTYRGAPSKLMEDFIDNARHLLDSEDSEPSITKAQGLGLLCLAVSANGQDRVGYEYIKEAALMCGQLEVKYNVKKNDSINATEEDRMLSKTLDTLCWGIFNFMTTACIAWQRPPDFSPPNRPIPSPAESDFKWTPYPRPGLAVECCTNELLSQFCTLSLISRDIGLLLYGARNHEGRRRSKFEDETSHLHLRLTSWHRALPSYLRPGEDSPPSILTHQTYYFSLVIALFTPVKTQTGKTSQRVHPEAHIHSLTAAIEIVQICNLHQSLYSTNHMSFFLVQPIVLALNILLDQPDTSKYDTEITTLCSFFRAMSRRWPFALAALRMFQVSVRQEKNRLPVETEKLLEDFEKLDWQTRKLKRVTSFYPVFRGLESEEESGIEVRNMSDFYEVMERLEVEDEGEKEISVTPSS